MKFYGYKKCSTCQKVKKDLLAQDFIFDEIDIVSTPPTRSEFLKALESGYVIKNLFNTSGELYRELDMKSKLQNLTREDAINLLIKNGKLVKRPFLVTAQRVFIGSDIKNIINT